MNNISKINYTSYLNNKTVNAIYSEQVITEYQNNPLIEALPNILSPEETMEMISQNPNFDSSGFGST